MGDRVKRNGLLHAFAALFFSEASVSHTLFKARK